MNDNEHLERLADVFSKFPGIGPRQAERFAYFIARSPSDYVETLTAALKNLKKNNKVCVSCFRNFEGETQNCLICADTSRTQGSIVLVEKDTDIYSIEQTVNKTHRYFVLGGLIPIASDGVKFMSRINKLIQVLEEKKIKEVIIALSAHPDADHTASFISNILLQKNNGIVISLLGRGLATGSELEYSDPETIRFAFENRKKL